GGLAGSRYERAAATAALEWPADVRGRSAGVVEVRRGQQVRELGLQDVLLLPVHGDAGPIEDELGRGADGREAGRVPLELQGLPVRRLRDVGGNELCTCVLVDLAGPALGRDGAVALGVGPRGPPWWRRMPETS